jgi:hypothetical protein
LLTGEKGVLDHFDCYELCVQSPRHVVSLLRAVHGGEPLLLREDFCGTAAVARRWAMEGRSRGDAARAFCTDLDAETLARAKARAVAEDVADRLELVQADALRCEDTTPADVVFVGNFSIGYCHTREALVRYLRRSRERLKRGNGGFGGGIFACDTYGGAGQWRKGSLERTHTGRGAEIVKYLWQQEEADPTTGMVTNSISFRVLENGDLAADLPRAFVYRWRLWSIPELREAMEEAGFTSTAVYSDLNLAPGEPARPADPSELGEDWIVLVAAREG